MALTKYYIPSFPTQGLIDSSTNPATTAHVWAAMPTVDVRHFGAIGDGVTDDNPSGGGAIDAAISSLPAGGGTVVLPQTPNNTYIVSKALAGTRSNVRILGGGRGVKIKVKTTLGNSGAILAGGAGLYTGWTFENLTFDGSHSERFLASPATLNVTTLDLKQSQDVSFLRCDFRNYTLAVGGSAVKNLSFDWCKFWGIRPNYLVANPNASPSGALWDQIQNPIIDNLIPSGSNPTVPAYYNSNTQPGQGVQFLAGSDKGSFRNCEFHFVAGNGAIYAGDMSSAPNRNISINTTYFRGDWWNNPFVRKRFDPNSFVYFPYTTAVVKGLGGVVDFTGNVRFGTYAPIGEVMSFRRQIASGAVICTAPTSTIAQISQSLVALPGLTMDTPPLIRDQWVQWYNNKNIGYTASNALIGTPAPMSLPQRGDVIETTSGKRARIVNHNSTVGSINAGTNMTLDNVSTGGSIDVDPVTNQGQHVYAYTAVTRTETFTGSGVYTYSESPISQLSSTSFTTVATDNSGNPIYYQSQSVTIPKVAGSYSRRLYRSVLNPVNGASPHTWPLYLVKEFVQTVDGTDGTPLADIYTDTYSDATINSDLGGYDPSFLTSTSPTVGWYPSTKALNSTVTGSKAPLPVQYYVEQWEDLGTWEPTSTPTNDTVARISRYYASRSWSADDNVSGFSVNIGANYDNTSKIYSFVNPGAGTYNVTNVTDTDQTYVLGSYTDSGSVTYSRFGTSNIKTAAIPTIHNQTQTFSSMSLNTDPLNPESGEFLWGEYGIYPPDLPSAILSNAQYNGVQMINTRNVNISQSMVRGSFADSFSFYNGQSIRMINNHVESSQDVAYALNQSPHSIVSGNTGRYIGSFLVFAGPRGITGQGGCHGTVITGNSVFQWGSTAWSTRGCIYIESSNNIIIAENIFRQDRNTGQIVGTSGWQPADYAITLMSADHCMIRHNLDGRNSYNRDGAKTATLFMYDDKVTNYYTDIADKDRAFASATTNKSQQRFYQLPVTRIGTVSSPGLPPLATTPGLYNPTLAPTGSLGYAADYSGSTAGSLLVSDGTNLVPVGQNIAYLDDPATPSQTPVITNFIHNRWAAPSADTGGRIAFKTNSLIPTGSVTATISPSTGANSLLTFTTAQPSYTFNVGYNVTVSGVDAGSNPISESMLVKVVNFSGGGTLNASIVGVLTQAYVGSVTVTWPNMPGQLRELAEFRVAYGDPTDTSRNSYMAFYTSQTDNTTTPAGSLLTEVMRISNAGVLGIRNIVPENVAAGLYVAAKSTDTKNTAQIGLNSFGRAPAFAVGTNNTGGTSTTSTITTTLKSGTSTTTNNGDATSLASAEVYNWANTTGGTNTLWDAVLPAGYRTTYPGPLVAGKQYNYVFTYVTGGIETAQSAAMLSSVTVGSNGIVRVNSIRPGPREEAGTTVTTTQINVYRTLDLVANPTSPYYFVGSINTSGFSSVGNLAFNDTMPDGAALLIGINPPKLNTQQGLVVQNYGTGSQHAINAASGTGAGVRASGTTAYGAFVSSQGGNALYARQDNTIAANNINPVVLIERQGNATPNPYIYSGALILANDRPGSTTVNGVTNTNPSTGPLMQLQVAGVDKLVVQRTGGVTSSGEVIGTDFTPSGLGNATATTRYIGGVVSAAPTTGTFALGDYVVSQNGKIFVCTTAGTDAGAVWNEISGTGGGSGMTNPMIAAYDLIYENTTPAAARLAISTLDSTNNPTQALGYNSTQHLTWFSKPVKHKSEHYKDGNDWLVLWGGHDSTTATVQGNMHPLQATSTLAPATGKAYFFEFTAKKDMTITNLSFFTGTGATLGGTSPAYGTNVTSRFGLFTVGTGGSINVYTIVARTLGTVDMTTTAHDNIIITAPLDTTGSFPDHADLTYGTRYAIGVFQGASGAATITPAQLRAAVTNATYNTGFLGFPAFARTITGTTTDLPTSVGGTITAASNIGSVAFCAVS
jgi:hypothetical protein